MHGAADNLPRALHLDEPSSCLHRRTGAPAARPARRALKYSSPVRTAMPNPFLQLYALQEYQQHDRARRSLEYTIYDKELTKIKADIDKVGRGGNLCGSCHRHAASQPVAATARRWRCMGEGLWLSAYQPRTESPLVPLLCAAGGGEGGARGAPGPRARRAAGGPGALGRLLLDLAGCGWAGCMGIGWSPYNALLLPCICEHLWTWQADLLQESQCGKQTSPSIHGQPSSSHLQARLKEVERDLKTLAAQQKALAAQKQVRPAP